jgi:hypothetical protein
MQEREQQPERLSLPNYDEHHLATSENDHHRPTWVEFASRGAEHRLGT